MFSAFFVPKIKQMKRYIFLLLLGFIYGPHYLIASDLQEIFNSFEKKGLLVQDIIFDDQMDAFVVSIVPYSGGLVFSKLDASGTTLFDSLFCG